MTEKDGGSDVSGSTATNAFDDGSKCKVYGYKWFSSATDADMTLSLARFPKTEDEIENKKGKIAMLFMKVDTSNNIEVVRLKDKFGTRQLPTAELILRGSEALRISDVGKGIKYISNMLNITRIHNAVASVSFMRRIIALVFDYSARRSAFGKKI